MGGYRIIRNSVHCNICNEDIESKHRHDFVWCKGEHVFVDGGKDYLRRGGMSNGSDCVDTSITEPLAKPSQETKDI